MSEIDMLGYEKEGWRQSFRHIAGVDEVGRGVCSGMWWLQR